MSIIYSHNVTLDSIFVNNTVTSGTAGEYETSAGRPHARTIGYLDSGADATARQHRRR